VPRTALGSKTKTTEPLLLKVPFTGILSNTKHPRACRGVAFGHVYGQKKTKSMI